MNSAVLDRYRCPEQFVKSRLISPLSERNQFFHFGANVLCYGPCCQTRQSEPREDPPIDLAQDVSVEGSELLLPFDPTQIIENLRFERYVCDRDGTISLSKRLYYLIRPFLPVSLRRQLQRIYFHAWDRIPFPQWPIDVTVDE